jgi:DNA anti-recombination protein RmuC
MPAVRLGPVIGAIELVCSAGLGSTVNSSSSPLSLRSAGATAMCPRGSSEIGRASSALAMPTRAAAHRVAAVAVQYEKGSSMENGHEAATKRDISELRAELKQDMVELRAELKQDNEQLRSEAHHAYDDLKETIRDSQTEMLKPFYSFAQSIDTKLKESGPADMMIRSRLSAVESRVTDIERRINQPPMQTH